LPSERSIRSLRVGGDLVPPLVLDDGRDAVGDRSAELAFNDI